MSFRKKDGFKFFKFDAFGLSLVLESERLEDCLLYFSQHPEVSSVTLDSALGFTGGGSEVVADIPGLRHVSMRGPIDLAGVAKASSLRGLQVEGGRGSIDLRDVAGLEDLRLESSLGVSNIGALASTLRYLDITKFRDARLDGIGEVGTLSELRVLRVGQSPQTTLEGIENLRKLEVFCGYYLRRLSDISSVAQLASNPLRTLEFDRCPKIANHASVAPLKKLESLKFISCGEVPSLKFLANMKALSVFVFDGTNVVDGDISPCVGIDYVGFRGKKHYSHTMEQVASLSQAEEREPRG